MHVVPKQHDLYDLAVAYAKILASHERAWLRCSAREARSVLDALEEVAVNADSLGLEDVRGNVEQARASWERYYGGDRHNALVIAYGVATSGAAGRDMASLLADVVVQVCEAVDMPAISAAGGKEQFNDELRSCIDGCATLIWAEAEVQEVAVRFLYPSLVLNSPFCKRLSRVIRLAFERLAELVQMPPGGSPIKCEAPSPRYVPLEKLTAPPTLGRVPLEWEVLGRSPILQSLVQLGEVIFHLLTEGDGLEGKWILLGLHLGLLAETPLLLPLDFVRADPRITAIALADESAAWEGGWYLLDDTERTHLKSVAEAELRELELHDCVPQEQDLSPSEWSLRAQDLVSDKFALLGEKEVLWSDDTPDVKIEFIAQESGLGNHEIRVGRKSVNISRADNWETLRIYAERRIKDHKDTGKRASLEGYMDAEEVVAAHPHEGYAKPELQKRLSDIKANLEAAEVDWEPFELLFKGRRKGGKRRINCRAENIKFTEA